MLLFSCLLHNSSLVRLHAMSGIPSTLPAGSRIMFPQVLGEGFMTLCEENGLRLDVGPKKKVYINLPSPAQVQFQSIITQASQSQTTSFNHNNQSSQTFTMKFTTIALAAVASLASTAVADNCQTGLQYCGYVLLRKGALSQTAISLTVMISKLTELRQLLCANRPGSSRCQDAHRPLPRPEHSVPVHWRTQRRY